MMLFDRWMEEEVEGWIRGVWIRVVCMDGGLDRWEVDGWW